MNGLLNQGMSNFIGYMFAYAQKLQLAYDSAEE